MPHSGNERISPLNAHELDEKDPSYRENYAVLELLRSLSIGKMVTVVGSGVTTIYGYMSWDGFINALIEQFATWSEKGDFFEERGRHIFDAVYAEYTEYKLKDRDDKNTPAENIAVFGELVDSLTAEGKEAYFRKLRSYFTQKKSLTADAVAERYRAILGITDESARKKTSSGRYLRTFGTDAGIGRDGRRRWISAHEGPQFEQQCQDQDTKEHH